MNMREITYTFCSCAGVFTPSPILLGTNTYPLLAAPCPIPALHAFSALHSVSALQHHRHRQAHSSFLYSYARPVLSPTCMYSSQCIHTRPCTCTGHHLEFYPGDRTRQGGPLLSWHSRCLSPFEGELQQNTFSSLLGFRSHQRGEYRSELLC